MIDRLLLVDDSVAMREAVEHILGGQITSIHWEADGAAVLAKAAEVKPSAIVLDISLPGVSGLNLLPSLREAHPRTTIVMLTNHADDLYRREAFARGADAYVLKSHANTDLLPAIWTGRRYQEPVERDSDAGAMHQPAAAGLARYVSQ